jgi:hypothetical protein
MTTMDISPGSPASKDSEIAEVSERIFRRLGDLEPIRITLLHGM